MRGVIDVINEFMAVYYDDAYFAESVETVTAAVAEYDDETCGAAIACWAYLAEPQLSRN